MSIVKTTRPVFKTTDGIMFDSELEAKTHQMKLDVKEPLESYISALGHTGTKHGTRIENEVLRWEEHKQFPKPPEE
jgi:hypothetical protein